MLTSTELADLRADLEEELADRITVRYQDGTTYNEVTYVVEPNLVDRATDVPAHVVPDSTRTSTPDEAGEPIIMRTYSVTVPYATVVKVEDEVLVTTSADTQQVGLLLTVKDVRTNTLAMSRRLRCTVRLTDDPDLAAVDQFDDQFEEQF